jgi:hypothetical protein
MEKPSKSKTGPTSANPEWDPTAITEAVQELNNLRELIVSEAFPGMRPKDIRTIRVHLDVQIATLSAEIAKAVAANQGKPFLNQEAADKIRKEATEAVKQDLARSVLDKFLEDED